MRDLTDPATIVEGLRLVAEVSDGRDPETGESYDTLNELMTNAANLIEQLMIERDAYKTLAEENHALKREYNKRYNEAVERFTVASKERDQARAEAAVLRSALDDIGRNDYYRDTLWEIAHGALEASPLAAHAAAVLAAAERVRDHTGDIDPVLAELDAAVDAYRSTRAGKAPTV